jgi:CRISPR-associated protein Csx14
LENGIEVKHIIAPLRLNLGTELNHSLTLDAWMKLKQDKGQVVASSNPPWNFWSGQQTSYQIWSSLREALLQQMSLWKTETPKNFFEFRKLISGRFGFDPGAAWNALDVGFSPNDQKMKVASSPATEMLAAVGIQRFRPVMDNRRESFVYSTWSQPFAPAIAAAAMAGAIQAKSSTRYQCRVVSRGEYAALSYSTLLKIGAQNE